MTTARDTPPRRKRSATAEAVPARLVRILHGPERRIAVFELAEEGAMGLAKADIPTVPTAGIPVSRFRLFDDEVLVETGMLVDAWPVFESYVGDLGEAAAREKVRGNLDLAVAGLGLPEKLLLDGQSLVALNPAGTILYLSIGAGVLLGMTQYP